MKDLLVKGTSAALALGLVAPGMAFAADTDHTPAVTGDDVKVEATADGDSAGTTAVTWIADDSQLDITVPNTIHVVAKADGDLMVPTNATITNNSIFAVHGTKHVTADAGLKLVEDVQNEDGTADVIDMTVTATGDAMKMGPAGETAIKDGDLTLNRAGLDGNATMLGLVGHIKLANDPAVTPTDAFTIDWHFQAGASSTGAEVPPVEKTVAFEATSFKAQLNETVKTVNFGGTVTGKGVSISEDGSIAAEQVGDTLSITADPGVTIAMPEDASGLMSAANGGANLEEVTGTVDTSDVTDMSNMFNGCTKLQHVEINGMSTANVESFENIFKGCENLEVSNQIKDWEIKENANITDAFFNVKENRPEWADHFDTSEFNSTYKSLGLSIYNSSGENIRLYMPEELYVTYKNGKTVPFKLNEGCINASPYINPQKSFGQTVDLRNWHDSDGNSIIDYGENVIIDTEIERIEFEFRISNSTKTEYKKYIIDNWQYDYSESNIDFDEPYINFPYSFIVRTLYAFPDVTWDINGITKNEDNMQVAFQVENIDQLQAYYYNRIAVEDMMVPGNFTYVNEPKKYITWSELFKIYDDTMYQYAEEEITDVNLMKLYNIAMIGNEQYDGIDCDFPDRLIASNPNAKISITISIENGWKRVTNVTLI